MLVEIMVSLSIFAIVAVSSAGALLSIIDANAKAQTIKAVMDNLSVAVENISRTMRIGTDFQCFTVSPSNQESAHNAQGSSLNSVCGPGTNGIVFMPQDAANSSDNVRYYLAQTTVNGVTTGTIRRYRGTTETDLTAPEVNINSIKFHILGAGTTDGQPRIFIIINGTAGKTTQTQSIFNIQTTVSQREIDKS